MQNVVLILITFMQMPTTPLRKLRRLFGLSLCDLAKAVHSDTGNLSRIETGDQIAKKDLAARLAVFYAPHIDELHIIYPERFVGWEPKILAVESAPNANIS